MSYLLTTWHDVSFCDAISILVLNVIRIRSLHDLDTRSPKRTSLVPIRVEFETETHRIRDCFVWNLYEPFIKPETFAKIFCTDLELPIVPWAETVATQIRAQLEEHEGVASLDLGVEGYPEGGGNGASTDYPKRHSHAGDPISENGGEIPECRVILSVSTVFHFTPLGSSIPFIYPFTIFRNGWLWSTASI